MRRPLALFVLLLGYSLFSGFAFGAKRIISLSPSLTMNIRYLGDEADLVGCTSYCKTSRPVTVVASAIKVNVEKVFSLKPDLVVTTSMTPPEAIASMKKLGLNVTVFPMPHSFAEICAQFAQLGKLVGKDAEAKKVLSAAEKKVNALKASKPTSLRMFIQLGADPIFAVIPNTFMNDYIVFSGSKNIAEGMKSGSMTRESVLLRNPDVIFIVTMGMIGNAEKKQWEGFSNLSAVRRKKVLVIDSEKACIPTPVTFAETMELIVKQINE